MMALAAGADVALEVRDFVTDTGSSVAIVDCMLPAGLAGAAAAGVRALSLVHFPYALARGQIVAGNAWTTDLLTLDATRRELRLAPAGTALTAWEAVDLLLVTAPRWFDVEQDYPAHVVHAGPLGVRATASPPTAAGGRILLSVSTTVMGRQPSAERVPEARCDAPPGPAPHLGGTEG